MLSKTFSDRQAMCVAIRSIDYIGTDNNGLIYIPKRLIVSTDRTIEPYIFYKEEVIEVPVITKLYIHQFSERLSKDFKLRLDNQTGWGQSFRIDDDEAQKMLEVLASDPLRYLE